MEVYKPDYIHLGIVPDDATIWRYVNLEKFLALLQSRQLFFASLDGFDDPYEGYYPKDVWQQSINPVLEELERRNLSSLVPGDDTRRISRKQCYVNC